MSPRCLPTAILLLAACVQQVQAADQAIGSDVGYPTITAALAGVEAFPATRMMVDERSTSFVRQEAKSITFWQFYLKPGQRGYPSLIRIDAPLVADAKAALKVNVLCEAQKSVCDALVRELAEGKAEMRAALAARLAQYQPSANASAQQKLRAQNRLKSFHAALEKKAYAEAYAMFTPLAKSRRSMQALIDAETQFSLVATSAPVRSMFSTFWRLEPESSPVPGMLVLFEANCNHARLLRYVEAVGMQEAPDGEFWIYRFAREYKARP